MVEPDNKTHQPKNESTKKDSVGDFSLNLTADTSNLDATVTEIVERLERSLGAFKTEWTKPKA